MRDDMEPEIDQTDKDHPVDRSEKDRKLPYEIYQELDLGPGGHSVAPSTETSKGVKEAVRRKLGR
jgi:hypothetical protein